MAKKRLRYLLVVFAIALALILIIVYLYLNQYKPPIYDPVHKP